MLYGPTFKKSCFHRGGGGGDFVIYMYIQAFKTTSFYSNKWMNQFLLFHFNNLLPEDRPHFLLLKILVVQVIFSLYHSQRLYYWECIAFAIPGGEPVTAIPIHLANMDTRPWLLNHIRQSVWSVYNDETPEIRKS